MIQIIPAIDVLGGKCVRLTQGDYGKKREYGDPVEMALRFQDHGFKRLHLVDLDGARKGRVVNYRILEKMAARTRLVIDAGGGVRSDDDLRILFGSGARMVTGGSIAVKEPSLFRDWLHRYGPEKIILGADFREGRIAVSGWSENTPVGLEEFIADHCEAGIGTAICTDIDRDGMLEGPSLDTYVKIKEIQKDLFLIASGGISRMEDIAQLAENGVDGVIVGKAIYERRIGLKELERYMLKNH